MTRPIEMSKQDGAVAAPPQRSRLRVGGLRSLGQGLAIWPAIAVLCVVGASISDAFLSQRNILNMLEQATVLAVLSAAMLLVLLVGKFDLSIESTAAFAPMLAVRMVVAAPVGFGVGLSPALGLLATFVIGGAIGLVNGFLVVKLKLNAFITTLAALILLRGATLGISSGKTISNPPAAMTYLGSAEWGGVPVSVIVSALLLAAISLFLKYHRVGRNLYAIGGNRHAARAAGIKVDRTIMGVFVVAGVLAALAGLILSGRIGSVVADQAQNDVFDVFAALAIGAVSLNGGRGTVRGAVAGVLFLSILANILVLAEVPSFWVDMSRGAIIVVALIFSRYTSGHADEE